MQNLQIFSVLDVKSKLYAQPFFLQNEDVALRVFTNAANDKSSEIYQNPSDYQLYCIGSFNIETGLITSNEIPTLLTSASSLIS